MLHMDERRFVIRVDLSAYDVPSRVRWMGVKSAMRSAHGGDAEEQREGREGIVHGHSSEGNHVFLATYFWNRNWFEYPRAPIRSVGGQCTYEMPTSARIAVLLDSGSDGHASAMRERSFR